MSAEQIVKDWYRRGKPVTNKGIPHEVKAHLIGAWAANYGLFDAFVETGTCHGAMVEAVADQFKSVFTIEMYEPNYEIAKEKLGVFPHVECLFGDSGEEILYLVNTLEGPALFFLDAHYSGGGTARGSVDTPIVAELEALASSDYPNVIIIDDARLFEGEAHHDPEEFKDYPSFEWISMWVAANFKVPSGVERDADEFVIYPLPSQ